MTACARSQEKQIKELKGQLAAAGGGAPASSGACATPSATASDLFPPTPATAGVATPAAAAAPAPQPAADPLRPNLIPTAEVERLRRQNKRLVAQLQETRLSRSDEGHEHLKQVVRRLLELPDDQSESAYQVVVALLGLSPSERARLNRARAERLDSRRSSLSFF